MLSGANQSLALFAAAFLGLAIYLAHTAIRLNLWPENLGRSVVFALDLAETALVRACHGVMSGLAMMATDMTARLGSRTSLRIGRAVQGDQTVFVYDKRGRLLFTSFAGAAPGEGLSWWTPRLVSVVSGEARRLYTAEGRMLSCTHGMSARRAHAI